MLAQFPESTLIANATIATETAATKGARGVNERFEEDVVSVEPSSGSTALQLTAFFGSAMQMYPELQVQHDARLHTAGA